MELETVFATQVLEHPADVLRVHRLELGSGVKEMQMKSVLMSLSRTLNVPDWRTLYTMKVAIEASPFGTIRMHVSGSTAWGLIIT